MVTLTSNNESPVVGDNITLTCTIELTPAVNTNVIVTAKWTSTAIAGRDLTSGSIPTDTESDGTYYVNTLTLTSLETSDSGDYTCTAMASSVNMFVTAGYSVLSDPLIISFGEECFNVHLNTSFPLNH